MSASHKVFAVSASFESLSIESLSIESLSIESLSIESLSIESLSFESLMIGSTAPTPTLSTAVSDSAITALDPITVRLADPAVLTESDVVIMSVRVTCRSVVGRRGSYGLCQIAGRLVALALYAVATNCGRRSSTSLQGAVDRSALHAPSRYRTLDRS